VLQAYIRLRNCWLCRLLINVCGHCYDCIVPCYIYISSRLLHRYCMHLHCVLSDHAFSCVRPVRTNVLNALTSILLSAK
jgi:hypothetical protein